MAADAADDAVAAADDAVAEGQAALDDLVRLLDLEQIETDIYRGISPESRTQRVFGGQVAGQALIAAGRTVEPERAVHSLHSYFIRPGDPSVPIVYQVDRVRDGRSFSTRRTTAMQHGKVIFTLSASFQVDQPGIEHGSQMPDAPDPESLPTLEQRLADVPEARTFLDGRAQPIVLRWVDDPAWQQRKAGPRDGLHRVWMRANGTLPDDPLLHVCVLTYASDMTLLDSILVRHGVYWGFDRVLGASLDHALWFHRPFRADEWFLYDCASPSAAGARGLATGRFFTQDGRLIATVVQEGLLRIEPGR